MHEPLSVPEVEHLDIEIRARVEPGAFDLPAPLRVLFCSSCACVHKASAGLANAGDPAPRRTDAAGVFRA
jgi:hypothetical protein